MNNYSLTYSLLSGCGNHEFNLLRSFSSSLRDIAQASLALCPLRSSVQQKYVVNNLAMCGICVNTHTHTHTHTHILTAHSSRAKLHISKQTDKQGESFFLAFPRLFPNHLFLHRCSAPPCGGTEAIDYGVPVGTHRAFSGMPFLSFEQSS